MIFLLIEVPEDKLMAYQHTTRSNFITHKNVDKLFGALSISRYLGIELDQSLGAGDTEIDSFLNGVGLAVIVGNADLKFAATIETIKIKDSFAFGDLLFRTAELLSNKQ